MKSILYSVVVLIVGSLFLNAQVKDKGKFIEYENKFWNLIEKSVKEFESTSKEKDKKFLMDFEGMQLPTDAKEFNQVWHNQPISQGWTGTCWCFSGTSYFESEIKRQFDIEVKLSEMYTVYWEYVEKARRFVKERGNSAFAEGSQANAVMRMWTKYGIVPDEVFTGLKAGQVFHGHEKMFKEMNSYLKSIKERNEWNEESVLSTIKSILNHYLGEPPTEFEYNGQKFTPKSFLENYLKIQLTDYVDIMSLLQQGYWQSAVYPVQDNWWNCSRYKNVPLDKFMDAIKQSVENKYSLFIGGDVSEPGYFAMKEVAMVPTFDIPSDYIDEMSRQFRFSNKSTTDDHGIHIVGYKIIDGKYWFLIKDSGSGAQNGKNAGYYFYHEDYIKLKMMNFMVHKDAIKELLDEFEKMKK